jgi:hypothetical protein
MLFPYGETRKYVIMKKQKSQFCTRRIAQRGFRILYYLDRILKIRGGKNIYVYCSNHIVLAARHPQMYDEILYAACTEITS